MHWTSQSPGLSVSYHQVALAKAPRGTTKPSVTSSSHREGSRACPGHRVCRLQLTLNWPASPPSTWFSYLQGGLKEA